MRKRPPSPPTPGRALRPGAALTLGLPLLLALGCGERAQAPAAGPAGGKAAGNPVAAVPAPPPAAPPRNGRSWVGVLVSRETIDVSAPVAGRLLSVETATGDTVTRGQLLARLDRSLVEQDLAMARSGATAAEADVQRTQDELSDATARAERRRANPDFFSKEDLAEAALREKTATSAHEAARARLAEARSRVRQLSASQGQTDVRAPFDGQVAERFVGPGTLVNPGTPIVRLLAAGEPLVRAAVPPEDSGRLKLGQRVGLSLRGTPTRLEGAVSRIAPEIDAASQMILIEIALDRSSTAAAGLRTGIVVDVEPRAPSAGP